MARDPEVILDTSLAGAAGEDAERRALKVWKQMPSLRAVRNGRVYAITDPAFTIPGSRLPDVAARLREILHPEENGPCKPAEKP